MGTETVVTNLGDVEDHVRAVYVEIANRFGPLYFVWGIGPTGDHKAGLALDFMGYSLGGGVQRPGEMRRQLCQNIAAYLLEHRVRLGLTYVIWDRRIASARSSPAWSWRAYDGSNPHTDHVHVSFVREHTYTPPKGDKMPLTDEDLGRVAKVVWRSDIIRNASVTDPDSAAYHWTPSTMLTHLEDQQDKNARRLNAIERNLTAVSKAIAELGRALPGVAEEVIEELETVLADAVVNVDVTVRDGTAE